jgi:hypothetical protein
MPRDRYHEFGIFDTINLEGGRPRLLKVVGVELRRPTLMVLGSNDVNTELEAAIARVLDESERSQLTKGAPYLQRSRCCATCGGPLGLSACKQCDRTFSGDSFSEATDVRLPEVVRQHLIRQGHRFA